MKMWVGEQWSDGLGVEPVLSPYNGEQIDVVPKAGHTDVERAIATAVLGARDMAALTAARRVEILVKAADLIANCIDDFARLISREEGKPLSESRGEASRMPDLLRLCAFEGSQVRGESLPLDAQTGASGKIGFTIRIPCGVVAAITPFNYPLLLVVHKVGPALAAGNAVVLKPAKQTPLTALKLTQILLEAGLPPRGIQCITGAGSEIGPVLCADPRIRKISFTGSTAVGETITRIAGVKRLSLELGSNCPLVVLPDADLAKVSDAVAIGGYVNAGQVCISIQRILVHHRVYADFLDALRPTVEAIRTGDPLAGDTKLGPMISKREAQRVHAWIEEAVQGGARVVTGGTKQGAVYAPTVLADVTPQMRIAREELFGPAVAVCPVDSIEHAIELANGTQYGLAAAIFTNDIGHAWQFVRKADAGNLHVNWTPLWRADFMPYGGLKQSGIGKEGPRYAVEEMTESKTVVFHGIGA